MKTSLLALATFALALLVAYPSRADESGTQQRKTVRIEVSGSPEFDVVYNRAAATAAGAALGGLIGASIQAGVEADQDRKKREAMGPHISTEIWQRSFVASFDEALRAKGYEPMWVQDGGVAATESADLYVLIYPRSYGLRMVDRSTSMTSAYVEFHAAFSRDKLNARKPPKKEFFYLTNEKQASYDARSESPDRLAEEIASVLSQGARRLANKIIYNAK